MDIDSLLYGSDLSDFEPLFVDAVFSPAPPPQRRNLNDYDPPPVDVISAPALAPERTVARARPKRPRQPSQKSLEEKAKALQYVVDQLPYVLRDLDILTSAASATTTQSTEDNDEQRIRAFLRRTILLTKDAHVEIKIQSELLHMLKHHHESSTNLRKLFRGVSLNPWHWMTERWRVLARDYYEKLCEDQCYALVKETTHAIETHKLPDGMKESDAFGWRDWVLLDADEQYVRFMIRKTLSNTTMKQAVDHTWSLYTDGDRYKQAHLGPHCEFFLEVLQQISPDVVILQRVEQYPGLEQLTHSVALAFRVQTDTGYMIAYRCLSSPRLQGLMKAEGLSLCGTFVWDRFDAVNHDERGECNAIRLTVAGSLGSDNPTYARQSRDGILMSLVRYETQLTGTPLLSIEQSPAEETETTETESKAAPSSGGVPPGPGT